MNTDYDTLKVYFVQKLHPMTENPTFDDGAVMQRIKNQDQIALSEFYDQYVGLVFGMAMRILQNKTLAEEATQDTFMKIWNQKTIWDPQRGKLVTWLLTLTRYTAIDRLRKEKRQTPPTAVDFSELVNLIGKNAVVNTTTWYDSQIIQELLQRLPTEQTQAIELAFYKGMSHREIAEHLQLPLGTVKSRIRQGLMTLRGWWQLESS